MFTSTMNTKKKVWHKIFSSKLKLLANPYNECTTYTFVTSSCLDVTTKMLNSVCSETLQQFQHMTQTNHESHSHSVDTKCKKAQLLSGHILQKVTVVQWTHTAEKLQLLRGHTLQESHSC
jgi:uncharacterized membrane protein YfhO